MRKRFSVQETRPFRSGLHSIAAIVLSVAVIGMLVLAGCTSTNADTRANGLEPYTEANVPAAGSIVFPSYVSASVRDAYEFALEHPEVLKYMPCYCGCGLMAAKHESNLDCFIAGVEDGGNVVVFSNHGSGCDICVEIARDARDLLLQGKSLSEIRAYVDATHGMKGPGTNTEKP